MELKRQNYDLADSFDTRWSIMTSGKDERSMHEICNVSHRVMTDHL